MVKTNAARQAPLLMKLVKGRINALQKGTQIYVFAATGDAMSCKIGTSWNGFHTGMVAIP